MTRWLDFQGARLRTCVVTACLCICPVALPCFDKQGEDSVCYYVLSSRSDGVLRVSYILVDQADFTEAKLRNLMERIKQRYDEPNMFVQAFSKTSQLWMWNLSLDQPQPPLMDIYGRPPTTTNKYPSAFLIYRGVDQVIRYNIPGEETHTIVVKGVDPASSQ